MINIKRILGSLFVVGAAMVVVVGATRAVFSDTETSVGNTVSAGSIDLKVNGQDGGLGVLFSAANMAPGHVYQTGCVTLNNAGTLDGKFAFKVTNPVSNDNTLIEPETTAGDIAGSEVDPTGYDANNGDGELWDQVTSRFCFDDGPGAYGGNGKCDTGVGETMLYSTFGTPSNDYSSYYSLPLDTNLVPGTVVIPAGGSRVFCSEVKFVDDTTPEWWGGLSSVSNNMAMTDDAKFDVTFSLGQI